MKKYAILLVLMVAALFTQAQMVTINMDNGETYAAAPTTYTLTNTTAQYIQFNAGQNMPTTQDFLCHLDSLTGNHTRVTLQLYGQKFATSAWTAIGSAVAWTGTTADTTIVLSNATANRYRNYKVTYTPLGTGTTKIFTQQFKLYLEN